MGCLVLLGHPGVGKTPIGRKIAEKHGLPFLSAGEVFVRLAKKNFMAPAELEIVAETNPWVDLTIDAEICWFIFENEAKGCVVDGRCQGHILYRHRKENISRAVLCFITCAMQECVRRKVEKLSISEEEARRDILARTQAASRRYERIYKTPIYTMLDPGLYGGLSHDTTNETLEQSIASVEKIAIENCLLK